MSADRLECINFIINIFNQYLSNACYIMMHRSYGSKGSSQSLLKIKKVNILYPKKAFLVRYFGQLL